ncbi:MFS general substrate transporter [Meredithblackwellia eburnea MCA 4105]
MSEVDKSSFVELQLRSTVPPLSGPVVSEIDTSRATSSDLGTEAPFNGSELPPVDGGRAAWLFLLCSFILECTTWGYAGCYGVIEVYLTQNPPFNKEGLALITSVGTISLALYFILPVVVVMIYRRFPHKSKTIALTAMVVNCSSMLLSSFSTKIWHLICLQGILGGISGCVLYTPVLIWLQEWFVEKRGMASGIINAGTGVGGFVFPYMIGSLLQRYGFAWTIRVWAIFTFVCYSCCLLTLRPRIPITSRRSVKLPPIKVSWLLSPVVVIMCITVFIAGLSYFPVALYIPNYTASLGGPLQTTTALAILNASITIGALLSGWLSDRYSYSLLMVVMGIVTSATALLMWGFADTLGKTFGFAVIFGLFSGNTSLWMTVSRDVSGTNLQKSSLVFCSFCIARGIASVLGPLIASSLYRKSDSMKIATWGRFGFSQVIIFVGAMAIASSVGGGILGFVKRKGLK